MFSRDNAPFSPFKLLGIFIAKRWYFYLVGVISVALTDIAQVLVPYFTGQLVDLVTKSGQLLASEDFWPIFSKLIIATAGLALLRFAWRFFLARQTHYAAHWLRALVYDNLRFLPEDKYHTQYSVGEVMSISTSDADYARFLFGFTLVGFLDTVFLGSFSLYMIGSTDMDILLWCLLFFTVHPWLCKLLADKEILLFDDCQQELSDLNELAGQTVQSIRMQRMTNSGSLWTRLLNQKAEHYRQSRLKAARTSLLYTPLMGSMELVVYGIVFLVGITKVMSGVLSIGEFVAIQSYILILQGPIVQLGFVLSDFQRARTCLKRLSRAYNEKEDDLYKQSDKDLKLSDVTPVFELDKVSFSHGTNTIIENLSLKLARGEHLGIRGEIGSGKTSLVKILTGIERRFSGSVNFAGKSIRSVNHKKLRELMSVVPQNTFLFGDTVRNNIAMDKEFSDEQIWYFLEIADVAEDVRGFEFGLDTVVGENGITLSGGQKQRLTLARALARNPDILFLDDALSAIDVTTEQKILKRLKDELAHMTVIWVAHRESTLVQCDRVIELGGSV